MPNLFLRHLALAGGLLLALLARAATPAPEPTVLTSDHLEMRSTDTETTAVAKGNVILTGTNLRITCDHLTLVADRLIGAGSDNAVPIAEKFKYILATGKVRVLQADREATCERAEIFPREDKVVLSQGPVLIDRDSGAVATGEPIVLWRGQRALDGTNVRITFPSLPDLGASAAPRTAPTPRAP